MPFWWKQAPLSLQKLIVPGQREEGENALHILLPPTRSSSLASNKTTSHMVEYTVPDEFTVSIPPRMGLVLIVCTYTQHGKTDSFAEKQRFQSIINWQLFTYYLRIGACRLHIIFIKLGSCSLGWEKRQ